MATETSHAAPSTHGQPSRKGKKAWRKNVDISEVQQGLDDVRDEVIQGGVIAEKESGDLFATDTAGDEEVAKKELKGKKLLKADEILAMRSAVPGLPGRKRKAEDMTVSGSGKKAKNGKYVPHNELARLRNVADGGGDTLAVEENTATHDPWSAPVKSKDARFDFLEEAKPKVEPKTLKHAPTSLTANGKPLPNVRRPDAGKSYNPLVGDWSALFEREGAAAVEAEKVRLAKEAEEAEKEARAAEEAAKVEAAEKEGDYDSAWESEWEGFKSEGEDVVHTQKQKPRKTPAERNKVKARKEREAKEKMERKQKERELEEKRIKEIASEVSARDKARKAHAVALPTTNDSSASDEDTNEVQLQRNRFGKVAVPEAPLEVTLPEDLEDSLRRLKPEGDLLTERYRNMLVNGKMEVRRRRGQKKQVPKERMEKWSYKDWRLK